MKPSAPLSSSSRSKSSPWLKSRKRSVRRCKPSILESRPPANRSVADLRTRPSASRKEASVKPDSDHWDLERLRSTDDPELYRALDAVKQQLPDPQQLAMLAASLSQRGISVTAANHASATPSSATRLKLLLGAGVVGPLTVALLLWRPAARGPTATQAIAPPATSAAHALAP